jgi:hypothetical protein
MSDAKLKAAAERLRAYYDSDIRCSPILVLADCETLAKAYLAALNTPPDERVTRLAAAAQEYLEIAPMGKRMAREAAETELRAALAGLPPAAGEAPDAD